MLMRVLSEREEARQLVLEIEAEAAEMEAALGAASRRVAKRVRIPGFRPGKAPREVVERFLGREALVDEAARDFIPTTYQQAMKARGLSAFAPPKFEVINHQPLTFRATIPLEPRVELRDYHSLAFSADPSPVGPEEVERALEQLRYEQAPYEPAPGPVKRGDLVVMDVEGRVEEKTILSQQGVQYLVEPEAAVPLPGFASHLQGMAPGEEKEFPLPFPPDHPQVELRGKEGAFRVRVREIKERHPLPDQELVQSLGRESMSDLRELVEGRLRLRAETEARRQAEEKVVAAVVEGARVDFSPLLAEQELDRIVREQKLRDEEGVRDEFRPLAARRLTRALVLEAVSKAEGIEVTPEEVAAEVSRLSGGQGGEEVRRFLSTPGAQDGLKEGLLIRKTIARLVELATRPKQSGEERGKA